ncbi:MAG TPA: DUF885 domain-containing protein [Acidobacteriota bacterium]|jgi:uncharacterized protein (DUF885 family)
MRQTFLPLLLLILICSAAGQDKKNDRNAGSTAEQQKFEQLVARWLEDYSRSNPIQATALGIHKYDDQLGDFSADGFRAQTELAQKYLKELESIPMAQLPMSVQADYRVLQGQLKVTAKDLGEVQTWKTNPTLYPDAPTLGIFLMASREYSPLQDRLKNIVARMQQIPAVLESGKRNLGNPPLIWTDIAIDSTRGGIDFFESVVPNLASSVPGMQESVLRESKRAADAYRDFLSFLKDDLLRRSDGDFRAGKENFEFHLKNNYLLDESSDQITVVGRAVFDRTKKQLVDVARLIDSTKDWKSVLDQTKLNHPAAQQLLDEYKKETARARAFILKRDLFSVPEGEKLQIIETPLFQRSTIPYAQYFSPAPFDKDQTGQFTVTPINTSKPREEQEEQLKGHSHGDIVNTVVHEAYPGHHLQFVYANQAESTIKKVLSSPIFAEGWALYSEELLSEHGYYTPEERLIQLQWTLVRAARVLIDIGLHTGTMSFDEAVRMLTDEVRLDKPGALGEVKRYTMSPTQPLSYLIGREIIFRIRTEYMRKQGKKYKVKNFHSEVLSYGTIPPTLIEALMFRKGLVAR